jgi:hypothetical protein
MTHISAIVIEHALRSLDRTNAEGISPHHATEAAHVLLANSPRHARRFALAMHSRVSRGLDTDVIEHWARVVMEVARIPLQRELGGTSCRPSLHVTRCFPCGD